MEDKIRVLLTEEEVNEKIKKITYHTIIIYNDSQSDLHFIFIQFIRDFSS